VESASSGLVAGINAALYSIGKKPAVFPPETAHGSLAKYITDADPGKFQPMNITYGLIPPLENPPRDRKLRNTMIAKRSLEAIEDVAVGLSSMVISNRL